MRTNDDKLDEILNRLARIEEQTKNIKETQVKNEVQLHSNTSDINKGKGAVAFLAILTTLSALYQTFNK